ncbi:3-dehydroquinate synthase [Lacticaseibacillus baoqingensis]|uniref:3-dehydroquinate synthase n=1 Tax=Lacticaseibacillus baoqingensis TaxID=2486013 RepID=A0ABW4EBT5_9LACO|nr:3-dehydroquinate synthase [Lacticaseibacillus baoqingensis]
MSTLTVALPQHPYQIIIESGAAARLGTLVANVWSPRRVMIVSDTHVAPLYLEATQQRLTAAGFTTAISVIPAGEASKTLAGAQQIYGDLIANGFSRSDGVLALGGGVVGDLAGFVASTFMRGLSYIQVPTSLLAQVDSSVGGKTAVDFGTGKNVIGSFFQPDLVVIDPDQLQTLSQRNLVEGYGEVVKMGALSSDASFWQLLETIDSPAALLAHAGECSAYAIAAKAALVVADERDTGTRRLLNFGHTLGHAAELLVPDTLHGEAVSMGMMAITRLCERQGLTAPQTADQIAARLTAVGLPTHFPQLTTAQLVEQIRMDKKVKGQTVVLVTLAKLGEPRLHPVPLAELPAFLEG